MDSRMANMESITSESVGGETWLDLFGTHQDVQMY